MSPTVLRIRHLPFSLLSCLSKQATPTKPFQRHVSTNQIPSPTPFVPDSKTFLALIGRGLSQHAAKIPTWESLFTLSSEQLRKVGVEPARARRYLLWWRDKFRKGGYGMGGDLRDVQDSVAHVRVVELPREPSQKAPAGPDAVRKIIVNLNPNTSAEDSTIRQLKPVERLKVQGAHTIVGPFVQPVKGTGGSVATIRVQEGMWEQRRNQKVDGGERRKVQVRRKRKLEEMKKTRS
ncbi:MAG: hypothetical protein Q9183_000958 [Haloplaca sp. 2 TL-2023]